MIKFANNLVPRVSLLSVTERTWEPGWVRQESSSRSALEDPAAGLTEDLGFDSRRVIIL